ncbi:MAG: hypothetical protein MMC33_008577 [Icmadophila ericetorum]|nr:hypothetical protein [Icmadophila ericetorum]
MLADPQGYPKLATYMGKFSDVAIFLQFRNLNMLNLMSLQAGLLNLEAEYRRTCSEDDTNPQGPLAQQYSKIFAALRDSKGTQNMEQLDVLLKIHEALEKYSTVAQISKLPAPDDIDLRRLREWLNREQGNFLQGHERNTWAEENDYDQITLAIREDGLSRSTATSFVKLYDWIWEQHSKRTTIADPHTK